MKSFIIKFSNGRQAKGIYIVHHADLSNAVLELGLGDPRPTLALVGGAGGLGDIELQKLRPLFTEILAPLAESLSAYVVDGGTDAGVMRLMGQAREKIGATFPLIGVAAQGTIIVPSKKLNTPEAIPLESHHTHFILIPGNNWGDESPWLNQIVRVLAGSVSSVTILINGGEISRKDVDYSINAGRRVVAISGTGRLADEIGLIMKSSPLFEVIDIAEGKRKLLKVLTGFLKGVGDE